MKHSILLRVLWVMTTMTSLIWSQDALSIDQRLDIESDGSAVLLMNINIEAGDSLNSLALAVGYSDVNIEKIMLDGQPSQVEADIIMDRDMPAYHIRFLHPLVGSHIITIHATIPDFLDWEKAGPEEFKTYEWEAFYTQTQPKRIDEMKMTIALPEGWNFHRIISSAPDFKKKEPKPPYRFKKEDGRFTVSISRAPLKYMEKIGVKFAYKNVEKPSVLIWIGILVSGLYLFFFRELVARDDSTTVNDFTNDKESK
jgi:hypothetical protein